MNKKNYAGLARFDVPSTSASSNVRFEEDRGDGDFERGERRTCSGGFGDRCEGEGEGERGVGIPDPNLGDRRISSGGIGERRERDRARLGGAGDKVAGLMNGGGSREWGCSVGAPSTIALGATVMTSWCMPASASAVVVVASALILG